MTMIIFGFAERETDRMNKEITDIIIFIVEYVI